MHRNNDGREAYQQELNSLVLAHLTQVGEKKLVELHPALVRRSLLDLTGEPEAAGGPSEVKLSPTLIAKEEGQMTT